MTAPSYRYASCERVLAGPGCVWSPHTSLLHNSSQHFTTLHTCSQLYTLHDSAHEGQNLHSMHADPTHTPNAPTNGDAYTHITQDRQRQVLGTTPQGYGQQQHVSPVLGTTPQGRGPQHLRVSHYRSGSDTFTCPSAAGSHRTLKCVLVSGAAGTLLSHSQETSTHRPGNGLLTRPKYRQITYQSTDRPTDRRGRQREQEGTD